MTKFPSSAAQSDRVALSRGDTTVVVGGLALLGSGLGLLLPVAARWLLGAPWSRTDGFVRWLLDQLVTLSPGWVLPLAGGVVGAVAGALLASATPVITVSEREVVVTGPGRRERFGRAQVAEAAVVGRLLVLHSSQDVELLHEKVEGDSEVLRDALQRHGWTEPDRR